VQRLHRLALFLKTEENADRITGSGQDNWQPMWEYKVLHFCWSRQFSELQIRLTRLPES